MSILQALTLGVVQGLTEFLPVSSSGHLIFLPALFGWPDQGLAFDAVIHLGTLAAVVVYFRRTLIGFIRGDRTLLWRMLASTVPAAAVGVLFGSTLEAAFRSPAAVAWNLIGWGVVLGIADRYARRNTDTLIGWKHALAMGAAQILALIPGTSRSGITMTAGLFAGLNKKSAAEFAFLMSVPIIALAGGKSVVDMAMGGDGALPLHIIAVGFVAAAVSGLAAIRLLLRVIERWNFLPFVAYRIVIGALILVFLV
jgi:undecaprenyl-diphosphatase